MVFFSFSFFFYPKLKILQFSIRIYIAIQWMKERELRISKCYKPSFFENHSERFAITNPANTCKPQHQKYTITRLHKMSTRDIGIKDTDAYCSRI